MAASRFAPTVAQAPKAITTGRFRNGDPVWSSRGECASRSRGQRPWRGQHPESNSVPPALADVEETAQAWLGDEEPLAPSRGRRR